MPQQEVDTMFSDQTPDLLSVSTTKRHKRSSAEIWHPRPTLSISDLYPEILSIIFGYLSTRDKGRVALVCTSWRDAAYHKSVWRGVEAKLHLKKANQSPTLFPSLVKRGIKKIQVLSLHKSLKEVTCGVPNLEQFTLTGCWNLTDDQLTRAFPNPIRTLVHLDLSMCKLVTEKALKKIAHQVPNLEVLDLSGCGNVTNATLADIQSCLRRLRVLSLRSVRNINDSGIARLAGQLTEEQVKRRESQQQWPGTVQPNTTQDGGGQEEEESVSSVLESLGLQDCQKLSDESLKYISQGCSRLRDINLSFCLGVSDMGLKHLSILSHLREVNLRSCDNITDTGIRYLSEGACSRLQVLDISFCDKITDQSLVSIAQGLVHLVHLSLNSCSITDEGLIRVSQSLSDLQVLNLGQCSKVTDRGLSSIAEFCQSLKQIDLYGCTATTTVIVSKLLELPNLTQCNLQLQHCVHQTEPTDPHHPTLTELHKQEQQQHLQQQFVQQHQQLLHQHLHPHPHQPQLPQFPQLHLPQHQYHPQPFHPFSMVFFKKSDFATFDTSMINYYRSSN